MESDSSHSSAFLDLLAWLEVNKKRVAIWAGVIAAGVVVAIVVISWQAQKEVRASKDLSEVKVPLNPGAVPPPGTAEAFLKVAAEHSGTGAGARALLQGASVLYVEGQYDKAQKRFDEFTKQYPESPWLAQAHFGIASCLDAQNKTAEAVAKYEEIQRRFAKDPVIDEVKLAVARMYEVQGKFTNAHGIYAALVAANQYSGIGNEAGMRKEDLEKAHPELKPPPPPPVVMPSPTPTTPVMLRPPPQLSTNNPAVTLSNAMRRVTSNIPVMTATNKPAAAAPVAPKP